MRKETFQLLIIRLPKPAWFLIVAFVLLAAQSSYAQLSITPVTWNVVGLDSNNVNDGPNVYPVGARICNTGGAAVSNVTSNFVWDTSNAYIDLDLSASSVLSFGTLAGGACLDAYYDVAITRSSAAYNQTRRYRITASGTGAGTVETTTPREIYVEKLVSQNRNSVLGISGPTTVYVGETYQYTIDAKTAPGGYEQLEAFLSLSNVIFRVTKVDTTYTEPVGATNDKIYADACGWRNDPTGANYRSCAGTGKAGGTIRTVYTVKIMSTGSTTARTMIYDFSGSSYHYNDDYGGTKFISITALPAQPDLRIAKSHTGNFTVGSTGTYNFAVSNTGTTRSVGAITVTDTLPAGMTVNNGAAGAVTIGGANAANWSCASNNATPQAITCTSSAEILAGASSAFNFTVNVGLGTAVGTNSVTNTAVVSGGSDANTSNNTSSDPTTILSPNLSIAKSHTPTSFVRGSTGTYNLTVTNSGTAPTSGTITVTDTLPTGLTVAAGAVTLSGANAANWSCSASGQIITCTGSTAIPISGANSSTFGFAVGVALTSPGSVTNTASVSGGGEATVNNGNNTATDVTPVVTVIGCSNVYATGFSGGRNSLYVLNGATMTPVFTAPQIVGGLAISANGSAYYDDGTFANPPLYRFDGTSQTNTGITLPNLNVGEAADAAGNIYYIDTSYRLRKAVAGSSGAAIDLGAITFEAGDAIGPQLRYGDMAIDGNGRLYWYSSIANGQGKTYLYQISPSNTFPAKDLGNIGPDGATGIAFDAAGKLITTNSAGQVFSIDISSSNFAATVIGTASPTVYDLGSCAQPALNPNLTALKAVANITQNQTPAVNAKTGDVLEYTITVTNNGNLPTVDAFLADAIPTGTTYVAGSTTLNGTAVADASGEMPYATAAKVNSTGQLSGVISAGNSSAVVKFRVTVNGGVLPTAINNTATVTYPKVTGGANVPQTVNTNTTSTPTSATPPNIGLVKSVSPTGTQMPGTELTYTIAFTNSGGAAATNFRLTDPDPSNAALKLNTNTDFKVGSVVNTLGTTGLTVTVAYSNDNGATFVYTPASGAGGAPAGYDRNVTHIRWNFAGSLSPISPNNSGSVSFVVLIR